MAVDITSLLVGLAIATILWWVISRTRPLWRQLGESVRLRRQAARDRRMSDVEADHRRTCFRRAQGMHLAAPLFALDEVLEEPSLLAPPARIEPEGPLASEDAVTMTVPYLPAWPELAAVYEAPALTLSEALAGGARLAILGQPGAGKTVALAHLATLAANRSEALGPLRDHVPFLLHVADLQLPITQRKELLRDLIDMTAEAVSVFDIGRVENFVNLCFRGGRALLLVDGYDELTDEGQRAVADFLRQVILEYPRIRVVVTGAPEHLDGILGIGFVPLALTTWNLHRQERFLGRWLGLWSKSIALEGTASEGQEPIDPLVLGSWLGLNNLDATPLELTLKAWAACAGDWLGSQSLDAIASHVRRLVPSNTPPAALETLAMQVMLTAQPVFDPRRARAWVKEFELPEAVSIDPKQSVSPTDALDETRTTDERVGKRPRVEAPTPGLLGKLTSTGLLMTFRSNRMRFVHPVIGGFLAGRGLRGYRAEDTLINQPDWIGKLLTMRYYAAYANAGGLVESMLNWSRLPMHRPRLTAARWLRDAPRDAAWRRKVLAALAELLQAPGLPLALRGQAVAALAASNDPAVALLFRKLISSASPDVMQLAALGAGAFGDFKAIPALKGTLLSTGISARRAACLALVAIGSTAALEVVGQALIQGDDDLRRSAAEALANDPAEGHAMLKDGATMANIPLRRATAYGLGRIDEPWAADLLEKMRVEDDQWIVRNAASEMIEARTRNVDPRAPRPLTPPSQSAWLIRFAGTMGVGISPGAPPTAVLLAALKGVNGDERLAAVEYLKQVPTEGIVKGLYEAMFGGDSELRETAFMALWEIGASGFKLPDPTKYGLN
ncbi:MAG: HEAT repeat domain-containing protein [Chloroflexota bacterium]